MKLSAVEISKHIQQGFIIPRTDVLKGQMTRFWIQIVPIEENSSNGYDQARKIQKQITGKLPNSYIDIKELFSISKQRTANKWYQFKRKKTAYEYLKEKFQLDDKVIENMLIKFDIKKSDKLKDLRFGRQKAFSIICAFQLKDHVIFDYFGLSPESEEQVTHFVQAQLKLGKTAISFDNLMFLNSYEAEPNNNRINNVVIWRNDKIGLNSKLENNFTPSCHSSSPS